MAADDERVGRSIKRGQRLPVDAAAQADARTQRGPRRDPRLDRRQQHILAVDQRQRRARQHLRRQREPFQHGQRILVLVETRDPQDGRIAGQDALARRRPRRHVGAALEHLVHRVPRADDARGTPRLGLGVRREHETVGGPQAQPIQQARRRAAQPLPRQANAAVILDDDRRVARRPDAHQSDHRGEHQPVDVDGVRAQATDDARDARTGRRRVGDEAILHRTVASRGVAREPLHDGDLACPGARDRLRPAAHRVVALEKLLGIGDIRVEVTARDGDAHRLQGGRHAGVMIARTPARKCLR